MAKSQKSVSENSGMSSKHELEYLPIDQQMIKVTDEEGMCRNIPAIDEYFVEPKQFVLYKPLSSFNDLRDVNDDSYNAAKEEWIQRMKYLLKDIPWLLKLPHHKFWSQVLYDDNLQQCLDSYLSHAPRDIDISSYIEEELIALSQNVHRLMFFVFLRLSTYKESKISHISLSAYCEMIYENYIFDIPKIMDLCVLYGRKSSGILKKMIANIFSTQHNYVSDLENSALHLVLAFDRVECQLNLNQKPDEMVPAKLGESISLGISSVPLSTILDVIYYVADISNSVKSFLEIYPEATEVFYKHETALRFASFYDAVFPPVEKELEVRRSETNSNVIQRAVLKVRLAKTLLVKIFRNLIDICCIRPMIASQYGDHSGAKEPASYYLEGFLGIFTEAVAYKHFICDYNKMFPIDTDIVTLSDVGLSVDHTRLTYIFNSIYQNSDSAALNGGFTFPSNLLKTSQKEYKLGLAKHENVKDLQSLAATLISNNSKEDLSTLGASASYCGDVELETLIVSVLEVFPSLGLGFIEECLKHYTFDTEKVIDALLQDKLPGSLQALDRDLERSSLVIPEEPQSILSERRNIYDYDEFDIFNRTDVDLNRIHQGKKNKTPDTYSGLISDDSEMSDLLKKISLNAAIIEVDEGEDGYSKEIDMYEDEYDDTYDSNMIGMAELQTEKELQNLRPFTTPRILEQKKKSPVIQSTREESSEEEEEEASEQPARNRDEFIVNPEIQRQRYEERRQSQAEARGRRHYNNTRGAAQASSTANPQRDRQQKEKHKGQRANHNRRQGADYKRSRGMGLLQTR